MNAEDAVKVLNANTHRGSCNWEVGGGSSVFRDFHAPDSFTEFEAAAVAEKYAGESVAAKIAAAGKKAVTAEYDDVCWLDIFKEVGTLLGIVFDPRLMTEKEFVDHNCRAFYRSLKGGCPYVAPAVVVEDRAGLAAAIGQVLEHLAYTFACRHDDELTAAVGTLAVFRDTIKGTVPA